MSVTDTTSLDAVADGELLYRSVWLQSSYLVKDAEGQLRVSSAAFDDMCNEISLFRHNLCETPPLSNPPRVREDDFVLSLLAIRIRKLEIPFGSEGEMLKADVRPDTTDGQHIAHAVIYPNLTVGSKVFYKLKKRLTEIIEKDWPIKPSPEFVATLKPR